MQSSELCHCHITLSFNTLIFYLTPGIHAAMCETSDNHIPGYCAGLFLGIPRGFSSRAVSRDSSRFFFRFFSRDSCMALSRKSYRDYSWSSCMNDSNDASMNSSRNSSSCSWKNPWKNREFSGGFPRGIPTPELNPWRYFWTNSFGNSCRKSWGFPGGIVGGIPR